MTYILHIYVILYIYNYVKICEDHEVVFASKEQLPEEGLPCVSPFMFQKSSREVAL